MGHISKSAKGDRLGKNLQPSEAADAPTRSDFFLKADTEQLRGSIAADG
jgi:hypothetical protein